MAIKVKSTNIDDIPVYNDNNEVVTYRQFLKFTEEQRKKYFNMEKIENEKPPYYGSRSNHYE